MAIPQRIFERAGPKAGQALLDLIMIALGIDRMTSPSSTAQSPGTVRNPGELSPILGNPGALTTIQQNMVQTMFDVWADAKVHVSQWRNNRFFAATIENGLISVGRPMTLEQAENHIRLQPRNSDDRGVITFHRADAVVLTQRLGGDVRPDEIHGNGQPGYFWHFHPVANPNTHIWYVFDTFN